MRYLPERNIFEDFFNDSFPTVSGTNTLMKTDIRKKDGNYMLEVEMPGYKKEDIKISLFNGNLTISASHNETKEEKDAKGDVIRSERYYGTASRTFYVGDAIKETDIHASYKDGILSLTVPTTEKKETEEKKFIDIL